MQLYDSHAAALMEYKVLNSEISLGLSVVVLVSLIDLDMLNKQQRVSAVCTDLVYTHCIQLAVVSFL